MNLIVKNIFNQDDSDEGGGRNHKQMADAKSEKEIFIAELKSYKLNMFRVAMSLLSNETDAEDAVSESVMKGYKQRKALRNINSFKPWIMKILVRECYKILRNRKKVEYYDVIPDIPVSDDDNTHIMWDYINLLPYEFRSVVVLFYYEDMSIKSIAKAMSLPEGTVKSRLSRGREKLKIMIEKDGGFDHEGF